MNNKKLSRDSVRCR